MKPIVAHFKHTFFNKSETFIFHYISNLRNFWPICLCEKIVNLDKFSFPEKDIYSIESNKLTFKAIYSKFRYNTYGFGFKEAKEVIRHREARLIHAHFGPNGYLLLNLSKELNLPLVTNFYGYDLSIKSLLNRYRRKYQKLFLDSDLFLVEGEFMKSKLIELGCPEKKIAIQRIAIPLGKFTYTKKNEKKSNEKIIFIFCGRFVEKKGLIYALKAFEEIKDKFNNFEFKIIGDGPLKSLILKYIEKHGLGDFVRILGFLDYSQYIEEMKNADIFIHPSITASDGDSEGGAPTTILEAQAMGIPVISTYHADIPNIVVPNESALLSEESDCPGLINNIRYLLDNRHIWSRMGECGREFVRSYHDIDKEVHLLEEKYSRIINQ